MKGKEGVGSKVLIGPDKEEREDCLKNRPIKRY